MSFDIFFPVLNSYVELFAQPHRIFSIAQDLDDGETCINFYEKIEADH
tara:strand:+ start:245 stop:388 length:144 start_codon:yes stop_codon:yes gene_type:complete